MPNQSNSVSTKLEVALSLIPYDERDAVGQALHAIGCDLDIWLDWVAFKAPNAVTWEQRQCTAAWADFPADRAGGNPNAVFAIAEKYGWIPDARSAKTEANRQSITRAEAWALAKEFELPAYLRNDNPETDDLSRLCRYGADDLRVVPEDRCYIALPSGYWTPLYVSNEISVGAMGELLDRVRAKAVAEVSQDQDLVNADYPTTLNESFRKSLNHLHQVIGQMNRVLADPIGYEITRISLVNFDHRRARPIVPLLDGTAIDLTNGNLLGPSDIKPLMMLEHGWGINYRPELLEPGRVPAAEEGVSHYGATLLRRMALHLLGTSKCIDSINFPNTNSGKTTLIDWFRAGFPGAVDTLDATKVFKAQKEDFAQLSEPLTKSIWVFVDECNQIQDQVPSGLLNPLTGTVLNVRLMRRDAVRMTRLGTLIMTGADWLPFDSSAQGADSRWTWAWYADLPPKSIAFHDALVEQNAADYLAAYIINQAMDLYQTGDDTERSPQVREYVAEMMHRNANSLLGTLRDVIEKSDNRGDTLMLSEIRRALSDAGLENVDKIHPTVLGKAIQRVSPRSMSERGTGGATRRTHLRLAGHRSPADTPRWAPVEPAEIVETLTRVECPECGWDNEGRPMTDIGICPRCALKG